MTLLRPAGTGSTDLRPDGNDGRAAWLSRRRLRALVGLFWLAAGALQLQPFMFTKGFAADVLGTAALLQPPPLTSAITSVEALVAAHPGAWNGLFAATELLVGFGMLVGRGRLARLACAGSVGWAAGVWILGEGAGGLLTGHAALSTGAPGAAVLYAVLTIAAWPEPSSASASASAPSASVSAERPLPAMLLGRTWSLVWLGGAVLAVLPNQWGATGLSDQAAMGAMMAPSWAVDPTHQVALWFAALSALPAAAISAAFALVCLAIGASAWRSGKFVGPALLIGGVVGGVLSVLFWIFGQGFGGLSTGTATDVGTGPLLMLLAFTVSQSRHTAAPGEPIAAQRRS